MKFAMGSDVLTTLTKKTSTSSEDLGALVRELGTAAEPLEGKFNGAGRAAFDQFKAQTDQISVELNSALAGVLTGISGMETAFSQGDQSMAEETRSTEGSVSFDSARFGTAR